MKKYTIKQIDEILEENSFHSCISENEKDGEYCYEIDTIQVSHEEGDDYFGEFVGNDEEGYSFKFYTN